MKSFQILLVALLLAGSALAQEVRYNFAANTDFSKFKTFKWVPNESVQVDPLTDQQIRSAIDLELEKKGLIKTEGDADLLLTFQATVGSEKQVTMYNSGWGYGPGWGYGWYGSPGITTMQTSTITTGQLDLDIYDAQGKDLVWRGTVTKTLDLKAKPEKRQKNLEKATAKLLKKYPPPEKKR
jgi:hypothetical protein